MAAAYTREELGGPEPLDAMGETVARDTGDILAARGRLEGPS